MIGQVDARPRPFVVVVLPIAVVQDAIGRHGHIQVADTTSVRKVEVAEERCVRLMGIAIKPTPEINGRSRFQPGTFGFHMNQAIQSGGAIQHGRGPFQHLHLIDILHRHHIPVDLTGAGSQD